MKLVYLEEKRAEFGTLHGDVSVFLVKTDLRLGFFQIRNLDGVRLLWSLLKNQNEAVQVKK
jgi:hypothetical protein